MEITESISDSSWVSNTTIRLIKYQDLPALEWDGEYTHFRRVYAQAFQRYQRGLSLLWVADLAGKGIIGQVFIQLICDRPELADGHYRAYLYSFRIRPEFRNRGLGSRMLTVLETDLKNRGYRFITLNVSKENVSAQKLYERMGYHIVAHEPGIWSFIDDQNRWREMVEPAWRMEKKIKTF